MANSCGRPRNCSASVSLAVFAELQKKRVGGTPALRRRKERPSKLGANGTPFAVLRTSRRYARLILFASTTNGLLKKCSRLLFRPPHEGRGLEKPKETADSSSPLLVGMTMNGVFQQ